MNRRVVVSILVSGVIVLLAVLLLVAVMQQDDMSAQVEVSLDLAEIVQMPLGYETDDGETLVDPNATLYNVARITACETMVDTEELRELDFEFTEITNAEGCQVLLFFDLEIFDGYGVTGMRQYDQATGEYRTVNYPLVGEQFEGLGENALAIYFDY